MDTSTTNEIADGVKYNQEQRAGAGHAFLIADGVKYNQEERAGAGHAFLLLRDYLKLAEGADFNLKSPFKAIVKTFRKAFVPG